MAGPSHAALLALATLAGCTQLDYSAPLAPAVGASGGTASTTATIAPVFPELIVLDVRADGARIEGRMRVPPPNADPPREIELAPSIAAVAPELAGAVVLDARFVGSSLALIGTDHVLRTRNADGMTREIDTEVHAPISVAQNIAAYARGEIPELEIARADLASGVATVVTERMAPSWSPALSADASAIVFVSGIEGRPRLYRQDGRVLRALARSERTPSSPNPPRWVGALLVFEDERGTTAVELETGRPAVVPNGGAR